jgi:hypothetical protein
MTTRVTIESKNHKYANTYGGLIHGNDFSTDYPRRENALSWADRIINDWSFDDTCRKNFNFKF